LETAKNGSLKKFFGAGTAAVVNPYCGFHTKRYTTDDTKTNSFAAQLKRATNIQKQTSRR
jgi:hypothetical protein